ncbi:MAG: ribonuclease P protein component [Ectothiorhodospiraceae bacterium AqS1]|nr:ribonuclease P protein component [Ectothiorhodospiraceae bacterium AqS1]
MPECKDISVYPQTGARTLEPALHRFGPASRLRKAREFSRVFAYGARTHAGVVIVIAAANGLDRPRLGMAIGRRRVRLAIMRQWLKRRIRESFRHHALDLGGVDFVVVAKAQAGSEERKKLRSQLDAKWERAALTALRAKSESTP